MKDEPVIVKMVHVRKAGMCSPGARIFFERHNLNWGEFLKNGIDANELLKTEDAMALKVIGVAKNGR